VRIVLDTDTPVAQRVLAIQRAAYAVEADIVGYDAIPPLHETLTELQAKPLIFLGVSCDQELAGVLAYSREGPAVDIDRLAVDPAFFRRGLATKLVRELFARERDATRFTVSTGFGNQPAIDLYERFGFQQVGVVEPLPGVRVVLLELGRRQWTTATGQ
jgi:ribosomal protein S18 acetylase RimI-like enzyme